MVTVQIEVPDELNPALEGAILGGDDEALELLRMAGGAIGRKVTAICLTGDTPTDIAADFRELDGLGEHLREIAQAGRRIAGGD